MSLQKSSVLVKMTVHSWDGFKKDKVVSDKVDNDYRVNGGGNYNKRLFSKFVLAPIHQILNRVRSDHKFYTIPWCYNGVDLLASKLYFEYTQVMRQHNDALSVEVENLIGQLPVHLANESRRLGSLFRPEEYPKPDQIRAMYAATFQFFPVPEAGHYAVDMEAKEAERLKAELTQALATTQKEAVKELYDRVNVLVERMHERLSDPEAIFRDSLIENLEQLVAVLPGLNVFEDQTLTTVCQDIKTKLLIADAEALRDDKELRRMVAANAFDVLTTLQAA